MCSVAVRPVEEEDGGWWLLIAASTISSLEWMKKWTRSNFINLLIVGMNAIS